MQPKLNSPFSHNPQRYFCTRLPDPQILKVGVEMVEAGGGAFKNCVIHRFSIGCSKSYLLPFSHNARLSQTDIQQLYGNTYLFQKLFLEGDDLAAIQNK